MQEIERERDVLFQRIEISQGSDTHDAIDEFVERLGDEKTRGEFYEAGAQARTIQQEGDALQQIVRAAGDDQARSPRNA